MLIVCICVSSSFGNDIINSCLSLFVDYSVIVHLAEYENLSNEGRGLELVVTLHRRIWIN